ncbi:MAG TPA: PAS domain S-box protein [Candidatus Sulfotelmatobacter sp.]|nr:PAS domain S-box protein [Candidatus Sulfotelmatobacter sp.]
MAWSRPPSSIRLSGAAGLRATFHKAAVGILEVDKAGRLSAVNERVCQILGYSPDELAGRTVREITAPEDYPRSDQLNAELRAGRRSSLDYEKRYLKRDGSPSGFM